jgi:hypothetical protein
MVCCYGHSDVQMYLLAIKSLYRHLKKGKIVAIIDRDTSLERRRTLEHHIPGIAFKVLEDIDTASCQRGGAWERLLYLVERSKDEFAIQLDADTLTVGTDISEILHCVENNIPFTLGNPGKSLQNMASIAVEARALEHDHICIAAERRFDDYPGAEQLSYVRASAAFAGLARGGIGQNGVEEFHGNMQKLLGARWKEWGSEQCASNFAVANSPGAVVLPYPKYANFSPRLKRGSSSFLHFFGTYRFDDDYYATLAREVIAELNSGEAARSALREQA